MQWLVPHIASTDRVSSVWASRELLYDSDLNALYYGDGASSGGILLATGTAAGITPAISGSNGSFTFSTVSFGNLNGLSFYSSNGSIVGSYSVPSVTQFLNTSQSSLFQLTADNSLSLGTGYTTHTHSQYINTSNSSLFRLTADNSLLQFTSNTSNITSNALNTSVSSLFLTSQSNQAFSASGGSSNFQTLVFNNANGLTFSNNGGSIQASYTVPNAGSSLNISAGTTSNNLIALTLNNSNGISFGLNGSVLTATVKTDYQTSGNYLTTAMASNRGTDFVQATAAFAGTNASGTIASNGISVSVNAQSSVPQNASLYGLGNTTQNSSTVLSLNALSFNGLGGNTVGYSNGSIQISGVTTNGLISTAMESGAGSRFVNTSAGLNLTNISATLASNSISLSVAAPVTTAGLISAIKVSAGTLSSNRTDLTFNNSNGVSFGLETNGIITATVATNYQSQGAYLTTAALSNHSHNFATTTTNGVSIIVATTNSNGATIAVPSFLTTAQPVGAYLTTAAQSNQVVNSLNGSTGQISLNVGSSLSASTNGSSITFGLASNITTALQPAGAYLTTAALSQDSSRYAGTNGAITGGSITVNTSGVSINLPAYLTTAMQSASSSNFAGIGSAITNGTMTFGTGGLSLNLSNHLTTAMLSNASTQFVQANAAFAGTNASGTIASNGISISIAAPGGGLTLSSWQNNNFLGNSTLGTMGQSTSVLGNCYIPDYISMQYLRRPMSISFVTTSGGTSNGATGRGLWYNTLDAAIFVPNTGASSLSYSRVSYTSVGVTQEYSFSANATAGSQYSISYSFTFPCLTNSTSLYNTSTAVSTSNLQLLSTPPSNMGGIRYLDIPWNTSVTPGNYVFVFGNSSSGATSGFSAMSSLRMNTISFFLISQINSGIHRWGSNQNNSAVFGAGSYSIAGGATTASLDATRITTRASQAFDFFQLVGSTV